MKKIIKMIRIFYDGSTEYLDGDDLEHFIDFEAVAESHALIHGVKIKWKKRK